MGTEYIDTKTQKTFRVMLEKTDTIVGVSVKP